MENPPTELTQPVKIYTDVERAHPAIICPIVATLLPSKLFIILSTNYDLISVIESQITIPSDYGSHSFSLTVDSLDFADIVVQQIYSFSVTIKCEIFAL
jgi:hypothetical protein